MCGALKDMREADAAYGCGLSSGLPSTAGPREALLPSGECIT